jgi:PIN domain nuclease of toxin-antitoxin system
MKRYYIDTCVLAWLLQSNKRVKKIASGIENYQGNYAVSMEVLKEFFNLLAFDKIKIKIDNETLIRKLKEWDVEICTFEKKHLKHLYDLPNFPQHTDPTDRNIIAHAIADKRILISGDYNFTLYEQHGLLFMEV